MVKRSILVTVVSVVLAFSFYTMYTNSTLFWDGYALEIDSIDVSDPDYTITVSADSLESYPLIMDILEEVDQNGGTVITPSDEDTMFQFINFNEEYMGTLEGGFFFLQVEESVYMVSRLSYGGMVDEPIYLYLSGLMILVAAVMILSELVGYLRSRK